MDNYTSNFIEINKNPNGMATKQKQYSDLHLRTKNQMENISKDINLIQNRLQTNNHPNISFESPSLRRIHQDYNKQKTSSNKKRTEAANLSLPVIKTRNVKSQGTNFVKKSNMHIEKQQKVLKSVNNMLDEISRKFKLGHIDKDEMEKLKAQIQANVEMYMMKNKTVEEGGIGNTLEEMLMEEINNQRKVKLSARQSYQNENITNKQDQIDFNGNNDLNENNKNGIKAHRRSKSTQNDYKRQSRQKIEDRLKSKEDNKKTIENQDDQEDDFD